MSSNILAKARQSQLILRPYCLRQTLLEQENSQGRMFYTMIPMSRLKKPTHLKAGIKPEQTPAGREAANSISNNFRTITGVVQDKQAILSEVEVYKYQHCQ